MWVRKAKPADRNTVDGTCSQGRPPHTINPTGDTHMRLRTVATATLTSLIFAGATLTGTAAHASETTPAVDAQRASTAPTVLDVRVPKKAAVSSFESIPVALAIDVPDGMEVSSVRGKISINGEILPEWELLSYGDEPEEYQSGTLAYDTSEYGIGKVKIVATQITYYPNANSASSEVEQTITSNKMTVKQDVILTGSIYRYSGSKKSEASATMSYYDVAKQEWRDAKGSKLKVQQQIVKKKNGKSKKTWATVTTMKVGKDGQVRKGFQAKTIAKSLYRLVYKGSKKTINITIVTREKI